MPSYEVDREKAAQYGLTDREVDVLLLAAEGLNSKEAGQRLGIDSATVRSYLAGVRRRLDASTTTHACLKARDLGVLR